MNELLYGPVYITGGSFKGHIMYYDDDEGSKRICYVGHPSDFCGAFGVPLRFVREPTIDDLLTREEKIGRTLRIIAIRRQWRVKPQEIHALWAEKTLIDNTLYERRMHGTAEPLGKEKIVFLCHATSDKGLVRMVNDDLRSLGGTTWLDENNVKVGESIVARISSGIKDSQFMILFLSPASIRSLWTMREWQSFLSRQLAGNTVKILPALIEHCEIPAIIADLKYANFTDSYYEGLKNLRAAME